MYMHRHSQAACGSKSTETPNEPNAPRDVLEALKFLSQEPLPAMKRQAREPVEDSKQKYIHVHIHVYLMYIYLYIYIYIHVCLIDRERCIYLVSEGTAAGSFS